MLWQNRPFGEHSLHKLQLQLAPSTTTSRTPHAPIPEFNATNSPSHERAKFGTIRKSLEKNFFSLLFHSAVRTII